MDASKPSTGDPSTAVPAVDDDEAPPIIEHEPRPGPGHLVGALLPLVLGVLWVWFAFASFPVGGLREPGPALWPVIVGVFLALISLVLLLTERDDREYEPFTSRWKSVAAGALATAVFIVIYTYVGFLVAGFLLMLFWARFLGKESWRLSLAVAVGTSLLGYLIFGELLSVPLPDPLF